MSQQDLVPYTQTAISVPFPVIPEHLTHPGPSVNQIFRILWAYRRMMPAIIIGTTLFVGIVSMFLPKTYDAIASILVDYEINDPLAGKEFPLALMSSYMATQVQLIESPVILLKVVDRLGLTQDKDYVSGYKADRGELRDWIAQKISKDLKVEQGSWESRFINVTYSSDSPRMAAGVANAVAQVYKEEQQRMVAEPASQRAKRYTEELETLRAKMQSAQTALTKYWAEAGVDLAGVNDTSLTELQHKLLEAQEARRLAELRVKSGGDSQSAASSAEVQRAKSDLDAQQKQLTALEGSLGPRHPEILALQAEVEKSRARVQTEINASAGNSRAQVNAARQVEAMLEKSIEDQKKNIIAGRDARSDGEQYQRDLDVAKQMYDKALAGYDEVLVSSSGGYSNINIVSEAKPPFKATKPKMIKNIALGFIAGCFLAFMIPLFREYLDRRVRSKEDFERDLGIPMVVEIFPVSRRGSPAS